MNEKGLCLEIKNLTKMLPSVVDGVRRFDIPSIPFGSIARECQKRSREIEREKSQLASCRKKELGFWRLVACRMCVKKNGRATSLLRRTSLFYF